LQDLVLTDTLVNDVSPLAGLGALRHLDLMGTRASNVSLLADRRDRGLLKIC
jgi:hypothetical protein